MQAAFVVSLYGVAGAVFMLIALHAIFYRRQLNLYQFSSVNLALIYFLVPAYVYLSNSGVSPAFEPLGLNRRFDLYAQLYPLILFSILAFWVGGKIKSPVGVRIDVGVDHVRIFIGVWALIGILCWVYFLLSYGGIEYVLKNISGIRSGTDDNKNYLGAFVKIFSDFLLFSTYFSYSHYLENAKRYRLFFLVLAFISIVKLFLDGGRGAVINFFLALLFIHYLREGRFSVLHALGVSVAALFIGLFGKVVVFALFGDRDASELMEGATSSLSIIDAISEEYSHQFLSALLAIDFGLISPDRYGIDLLVWAVKPLKLIGVNVPDSISYYNTYLITGDWDSQIPPGIIGLGIYDFGVLFCWIPLFLWGALSSSVDKSFEGKVSSGNPDGRSVYAILFVYLPFALMNSDPALFVQWMLPVFAFVFLTILNGNLRIRLIRRHRS